MDIKEDIKMSGITELPSVAILVVNWNKKKDVLSLLSTLQRLDYEGHEIIIVDNASTDGSVAAVKEQFPGVRVIRNRENLGGTGGFNTGLRYILKEEAARFDYIWLLDNDALIDPSALRELVKVAESDPRIGLAGSKIINPNDPDMIVELGANINWRKGIVRPFLRNTRNKKELNDYYDVDYVAVCSAIVRVTALEKIGVMDERYFLIWDDMDWGITFRRNGYRVVAVNRSTVFHPAFTEKGVASSATVYYAIRNPLLMFSKHARNFHRISSLFSRVRRAVKKICFFWVVGCPQLSKIYMLSVIDFLRNKWGQYDYKIESPDEEKIYTQRISDYKRFVIIPPGDKSLLTKTIQYIREQVENPYISLMVQKSRISLFSEIKVDEIIVFDLNRSFESLRKFITLLRKKFDLGVVFPEETFAYSSHALKNVCVCEIEEDKVLFRVDQSRGPLWKFAISFIIGVVISYLLFPIVLLFSFRYKIRILKKI